MDKKSFLDSLRISGVFLAAILSVSSTLSFEPVASNPAFQFVFNNQGVALLEQGSPVLFYQRAPKSHQGKYARNNYIHPLYSLDGDTLTEDFPEDHLHQRGVFWAWHQLFVDGQRVGDGWLLENFITDVVELDTAVTGKFAELTTRVLWRSPAFGDGQPYLEERSVIRIHARQESSRKVDFDITLTPLVESVRIGGSEDEKGYGGFSVRLRLPDDVTFTSDSGAVIPENLQMKAGPWMNVSGSYGKNGEQHGIAILCHPDLPNYPQPWILRRKDSMQNAVYPGREPVPLEPDRPVVLRYRLVMHSGDGKSVDNVGWFRDYSKIPAVSK